MKLDDALEYAGLGLAVFPIDPTSKRPRTPNGYHDATTDVEVIRDHWTTNPDDNIGLPMRPNGWIAIDIDPRNGGDVTFAALERAYGALPRDCVQTTPSGGMHIIMRDPGGRPRGKFDYLGLGKGVDIKCNGYCLAEGSTSASGRYTWISLDPANVPELPEAWRAIVLHPEQTDAPDDGLGIEQWQASTHGPLSVEDAIALRKALTDLGQRKSGSSTTYRAIRIIFHDYGLGIDDGWPYLSEWNEHCGSPHPQHELERRICNAADVENDPSFGQRGRARKSLPAEARIALAGVPDADRTPLPPTPTPDAEPTPSIVLPEIAPAIEHAEDSYHGALAKAIDDVAHYKQMTGNDEDERPYFVPASQLFSTSDAPPAWLVQGLVVVGGIAVVATEPKSAKTWLATEIALAVATGTKVVGRFDTQAGAVAYYYTEDLGAAIKTRVRSLLAGRGLTVAAISRTFHAQPRGRDLDVSKLEDCARLIASTRQLASVGGPVKLLVLDPLRNIHASEEDKADAMSAVFRNLRMIGTLLDCTILLVHHSAKASENTKNRRPGQRMRGSGAIHGFVDSGIYLEDLKTPDSGTFTNIVKSEVKAARSAGVFELTLKITDDAATQSAIKAVWDTGTIGETNATTEQVQSWRDVALDIVDAFLLNKLSGGGATMTTRKMAEAVKGKAATRIIALKTAVDEGWLRQDPRTQTYSITPSGEAISRERNATPAPVATSDATPGPFGAFAK